MALSATRPGLKVLVIGAGPVGLCSAIALRQDGHHVTVFERREDARATGHAIVIQPAAVRALQHLREGNGAFKNISVGSKTLNWWSHKGLKPFATQADGEASDWRFNTDRRSVQNLLFERAVANGVKLLFGRDVQRIEDDRLQTKLWTSHREQFSADLIIAADGIKSNTRKLLFPTRNVDPIPLRESIYLTTVPTSELAQDNRVLPWLEPGSKHGVLGPGRFVLARHMTGGLFGVQFIDVDHADPGPVDGNWNTPAEVGELRARFSDFGIITTAYLEHVRHAEKWQMAVGPKLSTWTSDSGRIILLGDAAHAMLPHAAQGLSQGIEDAVSLARMLRWTASPGGPAVALPTITKAWAKLRKQRTDVFVDQANTNAGLWSLPDGPEQEARDERIVRLGIRAPPNLKDVEMNMHADKLSPQYLKWVRDYDVVLEGERVMQKLAAGRDA